MRFAMMRRYLFVMIFSRQRLMEEKWLKPQNIFLCIEYDSNYLYLPKALRATFWCLAKKRSTKHQTVNPHKG